MENVGDVSVHTLDYYVRETTVANTNEEIVQYICYYLERNRPNYEVRRFLSEILLDENILGKVTIVNDYKFYENLITVKRDNISTGREFVGTESLCRYLHEVDTIHLNLLSFDQEEDVRAFYPNSTIDVVTDEMYLIRENSRFSNAVRKRTTEKNVWKQYFELRKSEIVDMLLDEHIRQNQLFDISSVKKHKFKADKLMNVLENYI